MIYRQPGFHILAPSWSGGCFFSTYPGVHPFQPVWRHSVFATWDSPRSQGRNSPSAGRSPRPRPLPLVVTVESAFGRKQNDSRQSCSFRMGIYRFYNAVTTLHWSTLHPSETRKNSKTARVKIITEPKVDIAVCIILCWLFPPNQAFSSPGISSGTPSGTGKPRSRDLLEAVEPSTAQDVVNEIGKRIPTTMITNYKHVQTLWNHYYRNYKLKIYNAIRKCFYRLHLHPSNSQGTHSTSTSIFRKDTQLTNLFSPREADHYETRRSELFAFFFHFSLAPTKISWERLALGHHGWDFFGNQKNGMAK